MPDSSEPTVGIAGHTLADDDLRRELTSLKTKQADIESAGTPDQRANHVRRTAELESEFLVRFGSEARLGHQAQRDVPTEARRTDG